MQSSAFFKIAHNAHKRSKYYRNCPHKPVLIHIKAQQPNRGAEALQDKSLPRRGGLQLPELQNNEDIREFYLGLGASQNTQSYRDVKHYRRRKRWLG